MVAGFQVLVSRERDTDTDTHTHTQTVRDRHTDWETVSPFMAWRWTSYSITSVAFYLLRQIQKHTPYSQGKEIESTYSEHAEKHEGLETMPCPFHFRKISLVTGPSDIWSTIYSNYLKIPEVNLWPPQVRVQDFTARIVGTHLTLASYCFPLLIFLLLHPPHWFLPCNSLCVFLNHCK